MMKVDTNGMSLIPFSQRFYRLLIVRRALFATLEANQQTSAVIVFTLLFMLTRESVRWKTEPPVSSFAWKGHIFF